MPKKPSEVRSLYKMLEDPEVLARYLKTLRKWQAISQPHRDAIRRSEQITQRDLQIVINALAA